MPRRPPLLEHFRRCSFGKEAECNVAARCQLHDGVANVARKTERGATRTNDADSSSGSATSSSTVNVTSSLTR